MCPKICFLSTCSLRLLSILAFGEFILLRFSIRREHHGFTETVFLHQNIDSHGSKKYFMLVLAPTKDTTSSLCPTQKKRQMPSIWDALVSCTLLVLVPFLSPSSANFHCSPAKPLKAPQLCLWAQSKKLEIMLHQVAPSHYTFRALKKIIKFYWISLYTAASLMNPHKS